MTRDEIVEAVLELVADPDWGKQKVEPKVQEAYDRVCAEVPIPQLKTFISVDTVVSQAYCSLPSTFSGQVLRVIDGSRGPIEILPDGLEGLMSRYPELDDDGDLVHCAVEGNVLWYQYIPSSARTLSIVGYNNPEILAKTTVPAAIPTHLHRGCLVYGTAWLIYNIIEEGLEPENKTNTNWTHGLWRKEGVQKLFEFLGRTKWHQPKSVWSV